MKLVKRTKKPTKSQLGKRSRNKGSNYEREIAKRFEKWTGVEFVRTPMSGGFQKSKQTAEDFRGDIVPADRKRVCKVHIECKNQKTWALPNWLKQAQADVNKNGRIPLVIFHKHNTSEDNICLRLEDFYALVQPENLFED